jgi:hypothetical protein
MVLHSLSHRQRHAGSEEAVAATRLALGLTAAVGGMAGGIGLMAGQPMGWLAIPAAIVAAGLAARFIPLAAWAGVVLWAGILPEAHAEAMLGPLLMILACVAIAVGPSQLLALLRRDVGWTAADRQSDDAWIEET